MTHSVLTINSLLVLPYLGKTKHKIETQRELLVQGQLVSLLSLCSDQAQTCIRSLLPSILSVWNFLPPNNHMPFRSLFKCQLLLSFPALLSSVELPTFLNTDVSFVNCLPQEISRSSRKMILFHGYVLNAYNMPHIL